MSENPREELGVLGPQMVGGPLIARGEGRRGQRSPDSDGKNAGQPEGPE